MFTANLRMNCLSSMTVRRQKCHRTCVTVSRDRWIHLVSTCARDDMRATEHHLQVHNITTININMSDDIQHIQTHHKHSYIICLM